MDADTIIAGGGLAGACAALVLSRTERVLLVEAETPAAGASGAAAGLVNPFMGRRARPAWRFGEALDALHALLDEAGAADLFRPGGVLRPVRSTKQAGRFREAAEVHPEHAVWLRAEAAAERFPDVRCPHGALLVRSGGAIDVPALIEAFLATARRRGAEVLTGQRVTGWDEDGEGASVEVGSQAERLHAGRVVLALGQGYPAFPELKSLGLHGIKGQTARVRRPEHLALHLPLSGFGYVVPDGDTLLVGSSYEHRFSDLAPSPEVTRRLLDKAAQMLPRLTRAEVLEEKTGVRVKPEKTHLPMVGPLPGRRRIWVFTGLGSKGLLTAPLLARRLPRFFADPKKIPEAVGVPMR